MPIPIELAEQVLGEKKIIEEKTTISIGELPTEFIIAGAMEGKLRITHQHVMFLCEKPKVSSAGSQAARIAVGIATLGWSSVVTGVIDNRKMKKMKTKLEHPNSFAIPLSRIINYDGKKGRSWSRQENHYLKFFVENEEESPLIIWVVKDINKFIDAFEKVKDSFGQSTTNNEGGISNNTEEQYTPSAQDGGAHHLDADPLVILKKRLAMGEITPEEYHELKKIIEN